MGIDVYMRWPDFTEDDDQAQLQGFSVVIGNKGYLREAYHGGPYATKVLIPRKCWEYEYSDEDEDNPESGYVQVTAAELRANLPAALEAAKERCRVVYDQDPEENSDVIQSFTDFVELAEAKEAELGHVKIMVSY